VVVLGDGSAWIWNLAEEQYPGAPQILDRWHAKESFSNLGKTLYGAESERGKEWIQRPWDQLDEGRFDSLLRAIARHADSCEEARKLRAHLPENRHRMDYPRFEREGLCTSTGVVELVAKWSLARDPNAPECIGRSAEPTPSLPCVAPTSVAAFSTSGSGEPNSERPPHADLRHFPDVRP
jgi:hypothetical protein